MWPNLESCALTRGKCAYVAALISQALIDKLQIIDWYNHRTKRCRVLSQDDGTSSSDRRAIECPKAGIVRKTRQCAHRSPNACKQQPPRQPFRRDRRPAIPGIKFGKCPRQLSKRRIHQLTTHSQRMICRNCSVGSRSCMASLSRQREHSGNGQGRTRAPPAPRISSTACRGQADAPHPGGNITGFHNYEPALGAKWMGILKEIAPAVRRAVNGGARRRELPRHRRYPRDHISEATLRDGRCAAEC